MIFQFSLAKSYVISLLASVRPSSSLISTNTNRYDSSTPAQHFAHRSNQPMRKSPIHSVRPARNLVESSRPAVLVLREERSGFICRGERWEERS